MSGRPWRALLLWGLAPTLLVTALSLYRPAALERLERTVYDTLLRSSGAGAMSGRIVIVDIDERSLGSIGQWPWRRDVVGRLIAALRDHGAAVVGLDVMFAEADRDQTNGVAPDDALAGVLREGRVLLGYAFTFDPVGDPPSGCVQHPLGLPVIGGEDDADEALPLFRATSAICNLPALTAAASGSGFLNAAPDPDGILRRIPVLMEFGGKVYPSMAVAVVSAVTGVRQHALHVINVNQSRLQLDDRAVPLDGQGNLLLRYRGPRRTFPYVSAADVLNGKVGRDSFAGKIVLVGTSALGTREVVATPLDTLFVGVEVHATAADNLLQQDFIRRPEHGVALETQAVLAAGILGIVAVAWCGVTWGALVATLLLAAGWAGAVALLSADGRFVSPLYPTAGLVATFAVMTVAQYARERQHADREGRDRATSQRLMVRTLLSLTEIRDADTGRHSRRTEEFTRTLATALAGHPQYRGYFTPERVDLFASLAPIHDIGKVGVPDEVLNKPGKLTADELVEMRKHPGYGFEVIVRAQRDAGAIDDEILTMAKDIVYTHHEKWDGTGYPRGLRGAEIPIVGRVMAIVDVYDAIMTRRAYQAPKSHAAAVRMILEGRGTHFDPDVIDAFVQVSPALERLSADGDS